MPATAAIPEGMAELLQVLVVVVVVVAVVVRAQAVPTSTLFYRRLRLKNQG